MSHPEIHTSVTTRAEKRMLSTPEEDAEIKRHATEEAKKKSDEAKKIAESVTVCDLTADLTADTNAPTLLAPSDLEKTITDLEPQLDDLINKKINALLDRKLDAFASKIVNDVLSGLERRITQLEADNNKLHTQNGELLERVNQLEAAAEASEQYSRRNCLRISGIPENPMGESTDDHVMAICTALDVPVFINDVDRSHRIGRKADDDSATPKPKPRQIIVKFATYRARQIVYKARTNLKNVGFKGTFINEDLTRHRSFLLFKARKLTKTKPKKLDSAWSSDGTVLVKDNSNKVHRIQSETDLSIFA